MTSPRATGILAFVLIAACQARSAQFGEEDRQANQTVTDAFVGHLLARQLDSLSALYASDAVVMAPGQGPVVGQDAIRQWQAAFPPVTRFEATNDTIDGNGEVAYVRGRYLMQIQGAPVDTGKYVEVRRRQADGSWKIVIDMFNSSVPAPTPPQPAGTKSR
jgi:ketosteroid isomerase-like protein